MEISSLPLVVKIIHEPEAKGSEYVACSPEFEVASCGATVEEARKNLKEAIEIVIESCAEEGTLDDFLEDVGFRPEKKGWRWLKFLNLMVGSKLSRKGVILALRSRIM